MKQENVLKAQTQFKFQTPKQKKSARTSVSGKGAQERMIQPIFFCKNSKSA
jgi:hypothetical protein